MVSFYVLTPIPGTEQYDEFSGAGLITEPNLDRFDTARPFEPWFWKLAANTAINYRRKRVPLPVEQTADAAAGEAIEHDPALVGADWRAMWLDRLQHLPLFQQRQRRRRRGQRLQLRHRRRVRFPKWDWRRHH